MENITYKSNKYVRKKMLDEIYKNNPKRYIGFFCSALLIIIAMLSLVWSVVYSVKEDAGIEGLVLIGAVLIFSSIPFFVGISLKNTFRYKCTLPYCKRVNETLTLTDTELEYSYFKVKKNNSAVFYAHQYDESLISYDDMEHIKIKYTDVDDIDMDGNFINIRGKITLLSPCKSKKGFEEKQSNNVSIMLDFEDNSVKNQLLNLTNKNHLNIYLDNKNMH